MLVLVGGPARPPAELPPTETLMYPIGRDFEILVGFDEAVADGFIGSIMMYDGGVPGIGLFSATDGTVTHIGWVDGGTCGPTHIIEIETHDGWLIEYVNVEEQTRVSVGDSVKTGKFIGWAFDGVFDPCSLQRLRQFPILVVSVDGVPIDPEPLLVPFDRDTIH
jgi:hypothetical protein